MGKLKPNMEYYDTEKVIEICDIVRENDVSSDIILKHQKYIATSNKIGLVQYYSLQGSYFMNQYLRNFVNYDYKNELLEENIASMWELINNAPAFDKSYIVYRFVDNDDYLTHLKIGDTYMDNGFMSTTLPYFCTTLCRNPDRAPFITMI